MVQIVKIVIALSVIATGILGALAFLKEDPMAFLLQFNPPTYCYSISGLFLIGAALHGFYQAGWEEAQPNEWLVIIQNGKQIKAGIGLICFRYFYQTAIKFTSSVQKVNFNAMQVSKEMQGLQIQGFAIWSVHRESPFTYYKQMHGANANSSIKKVCESIVRHQIANTDLETVMTKREILKDNMREQLQAVLTGWGVWLETVEITEVKICSTRLFEDMQTPSKQENYLKSELYKLKINNEMTISEAKSQFEINKNSEETETDRLQHYYAQEIKRIQQSAAFSKKSFEYEKQSILERKEFELKEIQKNHEVEKKRIQNSLELEQKDFEETAKQYEQKIMAQQQMSDINLHHLKLEKAKEIFQQVPITSINVNSYSTPDQNDLMSLIPGVSAKDNKK